MATDRWGCARRTTPKVLHGCRRPSHDADNSPVSLEYSIAMCVWDPRSTCHDDKRWRVRGPSTRRLRRCRKHGRSHDGANAPPTRPVVTRLLHHTLTESKHVKLFFSVASSFRLWRRPRPTRFGDKCTTITPSRPAWGEVSEAYLPTLHLAYPPCLRPSFPDMFVQRMTTLKKSYVRSRTSTLSPTT